MEPQDLKLRLQELGYRATRANGTCFDINQDHYVHYLSWDEAMALANTKLAHPVDLMAHSEKRGLNRWYTFDAPAE